MEFSFVSFSRAIAQVRKLTQQSEGPLTSGHWIAPEMCVPSYATRWRQTVLQVLAGTSSLSLLLLQPGGWSPATPGPHSVPFWGPAPLGNTGRAGYESHSLRRVPIPTPFPPGENISSSLATVKISLPPSTQDDFFQESYASGIISLRIKLYKGNFCFYGSQAPLKQGNKYKGLASYLEKRKEKYKKSKKKSIFLKIRSHILTWGMIIRGQCPT